MGENTPKKNPIEILIETGQQLIQEQNQNIQEQREIAEEFNKNLSGVKELYRNLEVSKFAINETDRELLINAEKHLKKFKTYFKIMAICFGIAIVSALINAYNAKSWYDTSVKTKREIREQILQQIANENKMIIDRDRFNAFKNERGMIKNWAGSNPNDSKSYNIYRSAVMNVKENEDFVFFEDLKNDDNIIHGGGKSGFFK